MGHYYIIGIPNNGRTSVLTRAVEERREAFRLAREWRAAGYSVRVLERVQDTGLYCGVPEGVWQSLEVHEDDGYPD